MVQLVIAWPHVAARGRSDFLVSDCNRAALGWVERWPDWPGHALVVHGPPGSGKSHLAHVWRERSGARLVGPAELTAGSAPEIAAGGRPVAVDDADQVPERDLLHLYNWCGERGLCLLILARLSPAAWPIGLLDLASRLRAAQIVGIAPPDDALLGAVLVKHFADRQLRVAPGLVAYLVRRMERSFAAAASLAARLDEAALASRAAVNIPLARRILAEVEAQSSAPSSLGVT